MRKKVNDEAIGGMRMRFRLHLAALLAISASALTAIASPAQAATYIVTDLGTLGANGSGNFSIGVALNDAGQVTGYSRTTGGSTHAFLYSGGVMIDLGTLGGASSQSFSINNAGQVVGESSTRTGNNVPFLYSNGTMTDLSNLGGRNINYSFGINDVGQITGAAGRTNQAFIYSNGVVTDLGTLGGRSSTGQAINATGQVAGYSDTANAETHAFLYNGSAMLDLGTLGGNFSQGFALNDAGQVTGYSRAASGQTHAFLYGAGNMTDLGTLGGRYSEGDGINNAGQVVGRSETVGGGGSAFIYSNGIMTDINDLIDPLLGWHLFDAFDINNSGQVTGSGLINGEFHAFLLTPNTASSAPEPATWAMMILGFAAVGGAMRRRGTQVVRRIRDSGMAVSSWRSKAFFATVSVLTAAPANAAVDFVSANVNTFAFTSITAGALKQSEDRDSDYDVMSFPRPLSARAASLQTAPSLSGPPLAIASAIDIAQATFLDAAHGSVFLSGDQIALVNAASGLAVAATQESFGYGFRTSANGSLTIDYKLDDTAAAIVRADDARIILFDNGANIFSRTVSRNSTGALTLNLLAGHLYSLNISSLIGNTSVQQGAGRTDDVFNRRFSFDITEAVPEPATWTMMILGFAGTGAAMRRRRPVAARPASQ